MSMSLVGNVLRSALGVPFRFAQFASGRQEVYDHMGMHRAMLKSKPDGNLDHIHMLMQDMHWDLHRYVYTVTGNLLLDTSLGWTLDGFRILTTANSSLVEQ